MGTFPFTSMKILLQKKENWNLQFREFSIVQDYNLSKISIQDFSNLFCIGSFQHVKDFMNLGAKGFPNKKWFNYSNYGRLIGDELLNRDYSILPAGELNRLKFEILGRHGKDCKIFVRPDEGDKLFTGFVLDLEEFDSFAKEYDSHLIIISEPCKIIGEWRFVACKEGEILGVSLYRYQDNLVSVPSCPPKMTDYVKRIAQNLKDWPDDLLVFDVAEVSWNEYKIVELNAFSSSGLYAMKPEKIVDYISNL